MARTTTWRNELLDIAAQVRHTREERVRAGEEGRLRRQHGNEAAAMVADFERLLDHWIPDPTHRLQWRAHLHGESDPPEEQDSAPPLLFEGTNEAGSVLEIRLGDDEKYEYRVDGALVERRGAWLQGGRTARTGEQCCGSVFTERFDLPREAVEALRTFLSLPAEPPPWNWAPRLLSAGVIDGEFAVTPRGQRLLESWKGAPVVAPRQERWTPESE